jgi:signal transduction histidine kinase
LSMLGSLGMLHDFLNSNRDELITRCRVKVAGRRAPRATERELEYGIPVFLSQLTQILREESSGANLESDSDASRNAGAAITADTKGAAISHGSELLRIGFTVDQVVHDYGDLCQAITELAIERRALITNEEFRTLNRCLDNAIADSVTEFASQRDRTVADANEQTINERLGFLAHEFRNLINTAMLSVHLIKKGDVGLGGSTGAILDRSLKGLLDLCVRTLVDVRLKAGIPDPRERVLVSEFIEEARISAAIDAKARGLELVVPDVEAGLAIDVDRQILAGAVANLLQNAFKFTRSYGCVSLRTFSSADRVIIEVEDECGGLPPGEPEELFRLFEQRSSDRSGLGLGLGISRRGVEANRGELHVRNLPGKGCVFAIDLPHAAKASASPRSGNDQAALTA